MNLAQVAGNVYTQLLNSIFVASALVQQWIECTRTMGINFDLYTKGFVVKWSPEVI
jgi:hypothetical protein